MDGSVGPPIPLQGGRSGASPPPGVVQPPFTLPPGHPAQEHLLEIVRILLIDAVLVVAEEADPDKCLIWVELFVLHPFPDRCLEDLEYWVPP